MRRTTENDARNAHEAISLQAMFDQHSAIQLIFNPFSGNVIDANPAACRFCGYSREELLSMRIQDLNMLPADRLQAKLQSELNGTNYFPAVPYRLKSGETRLLDVYSCPVINEESTLLYTIIFDVTDREAYREELFMEKELLRTTLESIGDAVVTTDAAGIITGLNTAAQELTGWNNEEAKGRPFDEVILLRNEKTGERADNPIRKVLDTGRIMGLANHTELLSRQGTYIPISDSAAPIKGEDGQIFGVVMVFRDVGGEKEHNKQIEFLSYHDSLTGLYNRNYMEEALTFMNTRENLPISVIMGDVNGLKLVNDVFGHKAGNALLENVAELFRKNCRADALIARWGSDEFVALMPRTSLKTAEKYIQSMRASSVGVNGSGLRLNLSLGCAGKTEAAGDIRAALQEAEESMCHQKLLDGKSYRNAIINTLLVTLYENSNETEEHSKRLEAYCHFIGRKLQLSSKEMDDLSLLALLHDIGKVGIDPHILKKPGPLTPPEWDEMKRHSEVGFRIVQATPELAVVADLILSHHERWDGKGYPRGLKGAEIPLPCRILAVADAYDAMTSDRVYRSAMSGESAIRELEKNAGTQFESGIVSLFMESLGSESQAIGKK